MTKKPTGRLAPSVMTAEEIQRVLETERRPSTQGIGELQPLIVHDDNPTDMHDFIVGRTPKWEEFTPEEIRSIRKSMGRTVGD